MTHRALLLPLALGATVLVGCQSGAPTFDAFPAYGSLGTAQHFEGMGPYTRTVTTSSPEAQRYFDQGLNWFYAFNHDEAVVSFQAAADLDPDCAMAWWGIAYTQGPNYNDWFMTPARSAAAHEATQRAIGALNNETPAERALVEALALRYPEAMVQDTAPLNRAYAEALGEAWARFPNDPDIGACYAESLMVQHPWMLYTSDGEPARQATHDIVDALERVLSSAPYHPGANHLYIHAIEPSNDKARALGAAERLCDLVPASGHMVHMPSHIYVQVGMWDEAIEQNRKSMAADAAYRERSPDQLIQHGYMAHNSHMLAFAAMMVGREAEALAAARSMWTEFPSDVLESQAAFADISMCAIYDVHKRFGRWDALLAEPAPPEFLPITTAVWRAHRAIAYAAKQDIENARAEQALFRQASLDLLDSYKDWGLGLPMKFLLVSEFFLEGEIALQQGKYEEAAGWLEQAVAIEDTIGYGEPPQWLQPARHTLGVIYLKAGDAQKAERVYRADLERWPGNGWSLLGLSQALEAQGKTREAVTIRAEFDRVWSKADEQLTTSCKCVKEM